MDLLTPTINLLNKLNINYVLDGPNLYGLIKFGNIYQYSNNSHILIFNENRLKTFLLFFSLLKYKILLKPKLKYINIINKRVKFYKIVGKPTLFSKTSNNIKIKFLEKENDQYKFWHGGRYLFFDKNDLNVNNLKIFDYNNIKINIPIKSDDFINKYKNNLLAGFNKVYDVNLSLEQENQAKELLDGTVTILNKNQSKYFLDAGTLLGAIRDKKFIPWDHDIDLGLIYTNQNEIDNLIKLLRSKYYVRALKFTNDPEIWKLGTYRIIKVYKKKGLINRDKLCLDIFIFYPSTMNNSNEKVYKYGVWNKNAFYPKNILNEFKSIEFYGKFYNVPKDAEGFLKFKYGDDWNIPKKEWSTVLNDKSLINNNIEINRDKRRVEKK